MFLSQVKSDWAIHPDSDIMHIIVAVYISFVVNNIFSSWHPSHYFLSTEDVDDESRMVEMTHFEDLDKDKDGKVTIEEILAFDDFEFVELAYNVFSELGNPGERLSYLVKKHKVLGTLQNYNIFTISAIQVALVISCTIV